MKINQRWLRIPVLILVLVAALLGRLNGQLPENPVDAPPGAESQVVQRVPVPEEGPSDEEGIFWGNPRTLQDHFDRHGGDFDAVDAEDYARQAHRFYLTREAYQVKIDAEGDGTVRVFDPVTNAFGAYNADGTTKTYFKPDDGQAYFDRQPGD